MRGRLASQTAESTQAALHIFFMAYLGDDATISEVVGNGDCGAHALLKSSGLIFDMADPNGHAPNEP
jgi:hypothetical protein